MGAYLRLSGRGWGEGGRLLTFSAFRMGANSRLGAYSNKYGGALYLCAHTHGESKIPTLYIKAILEKI